MSIIEIFRNLFFRRSVKKVGAPKKVVNISEITAENKEKLLNEEEENKFVNSLKVDAKKKNVEVETLICPGDGLGIQNKISY